MTKLNKVFGPSKGALPKGGGTGFRGGAVLQILPRKRSNFGTLPVTFLQKLKGTNFSVVVELSKYDTEV